MKGPEKIYLEKGLEVRLVVKRTFVRTRSLQEGMRIDQAIVDRRGRILIARERHWMGI